MKALEPGRIGSLALRNRIIKTATYEGMTPDGQITLTTTPCIGLSDQAPAILVNDVPITELGTDRTWQLVRAGAIVHKVPKRRAAPVADAPCSAAIPFGVVAGVWAVASCAIIRCFSRFRGLLKRTGFETPLMPLCCIGLNRRSCRLHRKQIA